MTSIAAGRSGAGGREPMHGRLRTLDDLDVDGRRVLLRADFNVPTTGASADPPVQVPDDARIRAGLTTIHELRRRGARLVIVSDLGRPRGRDPALSMRPVVERLAEVVGAPVQFAPAVTGPRVCDQSERLEPGQMLMLENIRFEPGEARGEPGLAAALARLADVYVNDDFAAAGGGSASTSGVAHHLPSAAGRTLQREVHALSAIVDRPGPTAGRDPRRHEAPRQARPRAAPRRTGRHGLHRRRDVRSVPCRAGSQGRLLAMPQGGRQAARAVLATPRGSGCRFELPTDLEVATWGQDGGSRTRYVDGVEVPGGWMALDIGAHSAARYAGLVAAAATVFWTGPMGRFELSQHTAGTRAIADAVAATSAISVIGGAETVAALEHFGLRDRMSHVSAGGTAMCAFLEGRPLPGMHVLLRRDR